MVARERYCTFNAGWLLMILIAPVPAAFAQQPPAVSADTLFQDGLIALRASRFPEAEAAFRKQMELEPEAILPPLAIAQVYMAQKRPSDAMRFLQEQAAKHPARADLKLALGDTAVRAGYHDVAITAFRAALEPGGGVIAKDLFVPRGTAGVVAALAKDADPVAVSMNVLIGKDQSPRGEAGVRVRLAETLQLKKDPAGAAAEWRIVSDLVPGNPGVLTNLAMQLEASGKKPEALKVYRDVLLLTPTNAIVLNNLAYLIADTGGDLYEALRLARRANTFAPGNPSIMDTEAWVALKQGFVDDALGTLLRLVELDPANEEFRRHLSAAITQKNVRSTATDELMKALNRPFVPGDQEGIRALLRNLTTEAVSNRK